MSNPVADRELLCAVLRGERRGWCSADQAHRQSEFYRLAAYHGVVGLVYYSLKRSRMLAAWPTGLATRLRAHAMYDVAREAMRGRELVSVLTALASAGVEPLLLKGTPLAYSLYAEPAQRQRADTDILIRPQDRERLAQVMALLGYVCRPSIAGELVSSQATYHRSDDLGISHHLDIHWRISNFPVFGAVLGHLELASRAMPVAALGAQARTLGPIDALLLACMHRLGHRQAPYYCEGQAHYDSDRLIWLYDIHLLAGSLTPAQWREFLVLAGHKRLAQICLDGLQAARRDLATAVPQYIIEALSRDRTSDSISLQLFDRARWRWELAQFAAVDSLGARWRLLREHCFPGPAYMRAKYPRASRGSLPLLYVHRLVTGLAKRWS